jgi:hypothetical protein
MCARFCACSKLKAVSPRDLSLHSTQARINLSNNRFQITSDDQTKKKIYHFASLFFPINPSPPPNNMTRAIARNRDDDMTMLEEVVADVVGGEERICIFKSPLPA